MTSRERVEAAFQHREPDRTPIFEYVLLPPLAEHLLGRPFHEYLGGTEPWLQKALDRGFDRTLRQYALDRLDLAQAPIGLQTVAHQRADFQKGIVHAADLAERLARRQRNRTRSGERGKGGGCW